MVVPEGTEETTKMAAYAKKKRLCMLVFVSKL